MGRMIRPMRRFSVASLMRQFIIALARSRIFEPGKRFEIFVRLNGGGIGDHLIAGGFMFRGFMFHRRRRGRFEVFVRRSRQHIGLRRDRRFDIVRFGRRRCGCGIRGAIGRAIGSGRFLGLERQQVQLGQFVDHRLIVIIVRHIGEAAGRGKAVFVKIAVNKETPLLAFDAGFVFRSIDHLRGEIGRLGCLGRQLDRNRARVAKAGDVRIGTQIDLGEFWNFIERRLGMARGWRGGNGLGLQIERNAFFLAGQRNRIQIMGRFGGMTGVGIGKIGLLVAQCRRANQMFQFIEAARRLGRDEPHFMFADVDLIVETQRVLMNLCAVDKNAGARAQVTDVMLPVKLEDDRVNIGNGHLAQHDIAGGPAANEQGAPLERLGRKPCSSSRGFEGASAGTAAFATG